MSEPYTITESAAPPSSGSRSEWLNVHISDDGFVLERGGQTLLIPWSMTTVNEWKGTYALQVFMNGGKGKAQRPLYRPGCEDQDAQGWGSISLKAFVPKAIADGHQARVEAAMLAGSDPSADAVDEDEVSMDDA
jgi:hypothetical protein